MANKAQPVDAAAVYAEKEYHAEVEDTSSSSKRDSSEALAQFTPKQERSLRHRVDWRLIPALGLMYGVSLMDRKNVSNAYIAGRLTPFINVLLVLIGDRNEERSQSNRCLPL